MKETILSTLSKFFLANKSSSSKAQRSRPDFQNTIENSNKRVLILEPTVISYKITDSQKENYKASQHLTSVVRDATTIALGNKGYEAFVLPAEEAEAISLRNEIEKKSNIYFQKRHFKKGAVSSKGVNKLDDNFGEAAIKLGTILDTNLIIGIQYISSFEPNDSARSSLISGSAINGLLFKAVDSLVETGITKQELYTCYLVLIDALTGNVIYSNNVSDTNSGLISVSEKDLFSRRYLKQVTNLIETALPERLGRQLAAR